ncbi:MAG: UvrD-helicase domain-containing protein [Treponema sp.]|jgi:ATP-dependent helicase/nuclease subunit A|nr:UvrD-helicase domain-containing protein [Treponema sp.]
MADTKPAPDLNAGQQAAAYCEKNAVVSAGAGSGKTSVLASRFAYLLAEKGLRVDQILTLTFTKKAAAEMYQRIYGVLGEIAATDQGVRGKRAREGIRDFIRARIQTLDSYSVSIVKQAASRYGIRPDFSNDDERCRSIAEEIALPFLIARRSHPAVEKLYSVKSPQGIARDIFAAAIFKYSNIDGSQSFSGDIKKQFAVICAEWGRLSAEISAALGELNAQLRSDGGEALLPEALPLAAGFASGGVEFPPEASIRAYFDFLLSHKGAGYVAASESHPVRAVILKSLGFISALAGLNLSRGKRKDNPVKEIIKDIRETMLGAFSSLAVFCIQAGLILSLASLLDELQEQYLDRKRAEGVLTFADVARLAGTILRDHPDIRKSEKAAFEALMIDEFQDNNELQKDLLFLLAENPDRTDPGVPLPQNLCPAKLFFVGDEKQSIYRFRGADVSVFRKLQNDLGAEDLPLKINYRSAPELIGAFNALFGGSEFDPKGEKPLGQYASVFAPAGGALPLFEAAYSPLEAGGSGRGKLSLCLLNKSGGSEDGGGAADEAEQLGAVENEARFTAERVQKLLAEKNGDGGSKYQAGDIAILFRSHGPQHLFEKHLRLLNIPYASEDLNGFFNGGPVNDIMSALRLAAYPLDAAAYAELLRSPFVGLSLPSLAVCLALFNGASTGRPRPQPFSQEALYQIPQAEQERFLRGRGLFERLRSKAPETTLGALVSELWYAEGYRYETEWNSQTAVYREFYDYLFHLAAKADGEGRSLAEFADSIQKLRDGDGSLEELDIPLERSGAVRLMTIHKSKGLEFPVVFLCCCGSWGRRGGGGGDVYDTGIGGVSFNPPMPPECSNLKGVKKNFFYEHSLKQERQKRTAELRRLLYVAMTRAEQELYITGSIDLGEDGAEDGDGIDLPRRLKAFVEGKREKNSAGNLIEGDTIIDDDTFFGLLLPAVADHIPAEGPAPGFFNLDSIPVYAEDPSRGGEQRGLPNNPGGLAAFLKKAAPCYAKIDPEHSIATPKIENNHRSPSSFQEAAGTGKTDLSFTVDKSKSGRNAKIVFAGVDAILERFAAVDGDSLSFTPAGFGTIAHVCVEALLTGADPVLPAGLGGCLSPAEGEALLSVGLKLAEMFLDSPLGRMARNAPDRKSEYPFRSLYGNTFINGVIDLLFEDGETVHVVDFKTDSEEEPGEHRAQMAFYYRAGMDLLGTPHKKECRVWLYYLRTGHAVEMTEAAKGAGQYYLFPLQETGNNV